VLKRSVFLACLVAIIGIVMPCIASAATSTKPETRVWGFELAAQTLVGGSSARTLEKRSENGAACAEMLSGGARTQAQVVGQIGE
jgi:hypothetical protein